MKTSDWNGIYLTMSRWCLNRVEATEFYHDTKDVWFDNLQLLHKFEKELFKRFYVEKTKNITIRYREWYSLCHKYIRHFRKENNWLKADFIFTIWTDGNHYFKTHEKVWDPCNFLKTATKEEVEQARKDFSCVNERKHTFRDDAPVLDYRGHRFVMDNEWGDVWVKNKKTGEIHSFQLIWDWYFPIDRYLDLEEGWKRYERRK